MKKISERSRKLRTTDLVTSAVDYIDRLIGSGQLAPGQRLIESDLISELGVGRMPIREALRILAGDGIVELIPNRGARIRTISPRQVAEMLKVLVGLLCVGIDEVASGPAHAQIVKELTVQAADIKRNIVAKDGRGLLAAMVRYHETIIEGSDNAYLQDMNRRVHFHHYSRHVFDAIQFSDLAMSASIYAEVTRSLRARNADQACRAFKASMAGFIRSIEPPAESLPGTRKAVAKPRKK
ncbi:MAG: GntR family transcriptional regulator [Hydrocarboniphaga sp.]|uniref:GntR family transcriptional regulator n=1 Tax=Hydrocarboniphaga sp. TaxID=2033016 RepID=UPI002625C901|nr:GntR family transcriptional regulator [Hydrocarboniphaga sp.]MDB5971516.1 GntR family transcriptional regulator [Hydrocarboniphaga sp.]